jgi:hypothetical protein
LVLVAGAAPAGAVVAKLGAHGYGVTPISSTDEASLSRAYRAQRAAARPSAVRGLDEPPFGGSLLENVEGGPVMHSVTTHVIYWDPPTSQFTAESKAIISNFFTDVAHDSGQATNTWGVAAQYTDSTANAAYKSTFAGAIVDSNAYPTSENCTTPNEVDKGPYVACLFDEQIQEQLSTFISAEGLPKGPSQLYFVMLPHNVASCLPEVLAGKQVCSNNFFCAYHSWISPGPNEIVYADIPFSLLDTSFAKGCQADGNAQIQLPNGDNGSSNTETRFADVALKYLSHEYIEAVTDPLVNFDTAWVDEEGQEIADKCNSVPFEEAEEGEPGFDKHAFTPTLGGSAGTGTLFNQAINTGSYYLQSEWDNAAEACLMKPLSLGTGSFSPPAGVAGSSVGFTGSASDPYGRFEPTWNFGDGASGSGVSPSHTYAAAGEYTVTMTPKDGFTGSSGAAVSHTVTITAPSTGGGGGGTGGGGSGGGPAAPVPAVLTGTTAKVVPASTPNSAFTAKSAANAKTGAIAFTIALADPGTLSWTATFPNGPFGAFSSASKCKAGQVRLVGKCRPAKITFAKGSQTVGVAGSVTVTLKPSASALKALKSALRHKKGVSVSIELTFQSSLGGPPVKHTQTVIAKLKT